MRIALAGSRVGLAPLIAMLEGDWQAGDSFWLMTDALAECFLQRRERQADPAAAILGFLQRPSAGEFALWVNHRGDTEQLRNDDVTLLAIQPDSASPPG